MREGYHVTRPGAPFPTPGSSTSGLDSTGGADSADGGDFGEGGAAAGFSLGFRSAIVNVAIGQFLCVG
jgi:hypothetical protein